MLAAVSTGMQCSHPVFCYTESAFQNPIPLLTILPGGSVVGIVFSVCTEPYLQSEYGSDYMSDSPVKLLEKTLHGKRQTPDEEVTITQPALGRLESSGLSALVSAVVDDVECFLLSYRLVLMDAELNE